MDPNSFNPFDQSSNNHNYYGQSSNNPNYYDQSSNDPNYYGQSSNNPNYYDQSSNNPNYYDQSSNDPNYYGQSSNNPNYYDQSSNTANFFGHPSNDPDNFGQPSNTIDIQDDEQNEENLLEWQALCSAGASALVYYYETFVHKEPCHTSIRTGTKLIQEILQGNETRCYQDFRMNKNTFICFCKTLVEQYGLVATRGMSEFEEVGMFLMTVAHGTGNRLMQEMWNHSGETISRHFHSVLDSLCRLAKDIIAPVPNFNTSCGYHKPQQSQYYPHFKDAIGTINGTHIKCRIAETERTPYFGRKAYATQNILGVCDFNMCFTFAWAGWEDGAHDSRILTEAINRIDLNFPHPTGNKYYLVDAGYAHKRGYMAPYKGARIRYHIQDFRRANGTARAPRNAKEKFNHLHSSCRMVIERTFGVWKARFAILANMPLYHIDTQTDIVLTTMAIHNYIRKSNTGDDAFQTASRENYIP